MRTVALTLCANLAACSLGYVDRHQPLSAADCQERLGYAGGDLGAGIALGGMTSVVGFAVAGFELGFMDSGCANGRTHDCNPVTTSEAAAVVALSAVVALPWLLSSAYGFHRAAECRGVVAEAPRVWTPPE